jgi:hypothetical protein
VNTGWENSNFDGLAMYHAIATMQAYQHGPPIQPDVVVNLDGLTRVYHGEPRPYIKRYRDWPVARAAVEKLEEGK